MNYKVKLEDIAMLIMIITTLAFHNYSMILAIVQLIGCSIIYLPNLKKHIIKKDNMLYFIWFGLFSIWGLLSLIWATKSSINVLNTFRSLLQELMVGFAVLLYMSDEKKIYKILIFLFIGSLFLVGRLVFEVPSYAWGTERVGNYIGYGNNSAPLVLSYVALIAFHFFQEKHEKKYLIYTIVFTLFSLLCGSKKAVIITILGISTLLLLKSKNLFQVIKRLILIIFISMLLLFSIMNIEPLYNVLGVRIEKMIFAFSNQNGGDMSTIDRMRFAQIAIDVFKSHPLMGVGLDNYRFYNSMLYYSHNNYLELAADLGIIGVFIYYLLPIKVLISCLFVNKLKNRNIILVFVILLVILILDVANVSYESDSTQLYIAIMYGLYIRYKYKRNEVIEYEDNVEIDYGSWSKRNAKLDFDRKIP